MKKGKTKSALYLKKEKELSDENNNLRFFIYQGVLLELTGNETTDDGHLMHHVKNVKTGKYKRAKTYDGSLGNIIPFSDVKLQEILKNQLK